MMTPFTAPAKLIGKGVSAVAKPVTKAVSAVAKPLTKVIAPVGKVVGKVAAPVGKIAGVVGKASTVGAMFFPPLAGVAAGATAVSKGAGLASSASKLVDGDSSTQFGAADIAGALPMLGLFP